jgi:tetratricopeptide (TPR) repeat protein
MADSWNRDAVYAQRVAELQQAIAQHPDDAQPLVDLAAFYLKPLAPRMVLAADGQMRQVIVPLRNEWHPPTKTVYAVPWVFFGDPTAAKPLLQKALAIDPNNPQAIREAAMLDRMVDNMPAMQPYILAALKNNPMDLDICRLYLDYDMLLASQWSSQAYHLRATGTQPSGLMGQPFLVPSQQALAQANQLDAKAAQARKEATGPLYNFAYALKHDPSLGHDPAKQSEDDLANAIYYDSIGNLGVAGGAAKAALMHDPTNLDALDFLIDLCRGTHTDNLLAVYKPILDRWMGADSSPVIIDDTPAPVAVR